jgi:phosphatidylethanolamine/phosphatidyl-N-methylethanolamine N-methyltransferase
MMQYDFVSFFRALMADPYRVGAITPSGPALAELITREISASTGPVIELGPGTGVFTSALLRRGVREENLALIEYGSDFVRLLQLRFPDAHVLWMDAAQLKNLAVFEKASAGAVVSGLPL